ncbi:MAG: type II toxin-antitoxin system HicB family antitoxin [Candidatus Krumholzibacteriia bacterium]
MNTTLAYREYLARVELDLDAGILHGEVVNLRDVLTFQATSIDELRREFANTMDDYLAFCAERGQQPERPFSGRALLRMPPDLHRAVATCAARSGLSLNRWVVARLRECTARDLPGAPTPEERAPWV